MLVFECLLVLDDYSVLELVAPIFASYQVPCFGVELEVVNGVSFRAVGLEKHQIKAGLGLDDLYQLELAHEVDFTKLKNLIWPEHEPLLVGAVTVDINECTEFRSHISEIESFFPESYLHMLATCATVPHDFWVTFSACN